MKIWVVGKDGMLAKALIRECQMQNILCVSSSHKEADITDFKALQDFFPKCTHIVNCAALMDVDQCELQPEIAHLVNAEGPANLARLANLHGVKFTHISTDYVFDGKKQTDYTESDKCSPINVYGHTKRKGELYALGENASSLVLRVASLYGRGKENIVTRSLSALMQKKEVKGITDQISSPTIVDDVARVILALSTEEGIFHYVNQGVASRYDLLLQTKHIAEEMGIQLACEHLIPITQIEAERDAVRPVRTVLSCDKAKKLLPSKFFPAYEERLKNFLLELQCS